MTDMLPVLGRIDVFNRVTVEAPRPEVFDALCRMGQWWPHRFKAGATVVLEPYVGGRFYEDWGAGGGALYGNVSVLAANERITVRGPMGIRGPVASVWTIELSDADAGRTTVHGSHRAFGDIDEDTAEDYTDGWGEVFGALKGYLTGSPTIAAPLS